MMLSDRTKGIAGISAASAIWGFNFVSTKFAVDEMDPFALMLFRFILATLMFVVILKLRREKLVSLMAHWKKVLPLALLGIVSNQLLFLWGIQHTTPAHSGLMYTLLPLFTVIFAAFIIKEKIPLLRLAGIMIAFVGAVVLASDGEISFSSENLFGDIITLGAVISFALFIVMAKPVLAELGVLKTLVLSYILSTPFVVAFCTLPAMRQDWSSISLKAWGGAWYLIIFATVIAYFAHQYALKRLSAALVAVFSYTQPALAAVFSVFLRNEELTNAFYISSVLIFAGLLLAQIKPRRMNAAAQGIHS